MGSVWTLGDLSGSGHPPLCGRIAVDVAVIGGGITGITTALALRERGRRVAVLEAGRIGRRNTGGSTGNLYATLSSGLAPLRARWGADVTREVVALRQQAVDAIEETVARHGLPCGFVRVPLLQAVADDAERAEQLSDECGAAHEAGLACELLDALPQLPFPLRRALRIERQAQFNPLAYVQALAQAAARAGVLVYEGSAVTDVDGGDGIITTTDGEVAAEHVIFATHTPIGFNLVQAEMEVFREYGIAAPCSLPAMADAIVWIGDQQRSLRRCQDGGRDHLVVVGEKHGTGHGDGDGCHARLEQWLAQRYPIAAVTHRWSAQQFVPADGLPYIGRSAHHNLLIATGFGADGLVWGTVAAQLLTALVVEEPARGADLLTPRRFTPVKSARLWARENASVIGHLVGDRLGRAELDRIADVAPGDGRIVDIDGRKHAVHRSHDDELFVLSPVCPHMKCHVAWNAAETSWDCPCHGSRFRPDGTVLEGPAMRPLERMHVGEDTRPPVPPGPRPEPPAAGG